MRCPTRVSVLVCLKNTKLFTSTIFPSEYGLSPSTSHQKNAAFRVSEPKFTIEFPKYFWEMFGLVLNQTALKKKNIESNVLNQEKYYCLQLFFIKNFYFNRYNLCFSYLPNKHFAKQFGNSMVNISSDLTLLLSGGAIYTYLLNP